MKEAPGVVIALHVKRGNGEKFALQATEDILFNILVAIGQYPVGQGEAG